MLFRGRHKNTSPFKAKYKSMVILPNISGLKVIHKQEVFENEKIFIGGAGIEYVFGSGINAGGE